MRRKSATGETSGWRTRGKDSRVIACNFNHKNKSSAKSDFIRTCLISAGGLIYLDVITQELADMGACIRCGP